jgi:phosphoglycolate phosphatase
MSSKKLIIYDLDGTLVDSASVVSCILNDMRCELGHERLLKESYYPWISLGGEDLIKNALKIADDEVANYLRVFRDRYFSQPTPINSINEGVAESLETLQLLNFSLAICTNKPRHLANKVLAETGLGRYFGFINAGGDLPNKKPHPSNILLCMDFFGLKADQVLYVGDSLVDQKLADSVGVPFVLYEGGYDDGVVADLAFARIKKHPELINILT